MRQSRLLGMLAIFTVVGCADSHRPEPSSGVFDGVPGSYPATASFADSEDMSGSVILNLWDMAESDDNITQLMFQASSGDGLGGAHVVVNAVTLPPDSLEDLASGNTVVLPYPGMGGPIGYGVVPPGEVPDYSHLTWRWPTSIQLTRHEGSGMSIRIELGPRVAADAPSTEISDDESSMLIEGLLAISCRPESGLEDLGFVSPFCAAILDGAPSLAVLADVTR